MFLKAETYSRRMMAANKSTSHIFFSCSESVVEDPVGTEASVQHTVSSCMYVLFLVFLIASIHCSYITITGASTGSIH